MNQDLSVFEPILLKLKDHEEDVISIKGRMFLVRPASQDDLDRIAKGPRSMD